MPVYAQFAAKMIPQAQASGVNGSDGMEIIFIFPCSMYCLCKNVFCWPPASGNHYDT